MPVADYRCTECGQVWEHEAPTLPETIEKTHDKHPNRRVLCPNKVLYRVWSFSIGRGTSGGTPPR